MKEEQLRILLERETERINRPEFIVSDPVQFPRRFSRQQDIEIAALLAAILAWGNRKMICRDIDRLLADMNGEPFLFIKEKGYELMDATKNIHRTIFGRDIQWLMRGLGMVYSRHNSIEAFLDAIGANKDELPAWTFADALNAICKDATGEASCPRCLPSNMTSTALKRVNMAFRWLVRDDGIVDIGIWKSIPKSKLFIPLDVHVGNTSRSLGLLNRKANDKKSVIELTERLRCFDSADPVKYDFALFGIGVNGIQIKN